MPQEEIKNTEQPSQAAQTEEIEIRVKLPENPPSFKDEPSIRMLFEVLSMIFTISKIPASDIRRVEELTQAAFQNGFIAGAEFTLDRLQKELDKRPSNVVS